MLPTLFGNQKGIRVVKAQSDKDHPYSIINVAAMEDAMKTLRPNAFKLWCYLACNQDGYEFGLSYKDVREKCNISENTYSSAVNELIEKNYLIKFELYPNLWGYLFLEKREPELISFLKN